MLLVDDLSVLLSLGVSTGAALDFSHYCRATVCSQLQVSFYCHCAAISRGYLFSERNFDLGGRATW